MLDVQQLRALCKKATPPPWTADVSEPDDCVVWAAGRVEQCSLVGNVGDTVTPVIQDHEKAQIFFDAEINDCKFIAAAREALPELLDRIEVLERVAREASAVCAELEKERERREKAEAVVRYYEELLVSPFDPRSLALEDGGHAKIPSPQRVRDILSENARMRDALGRILGSGNLFAHYAVARAAIRPGKDHPAGCCPECGYRPGAIPCDYRACAQAWCERKELHAELDRRAAAGS